MPTQDKSQTTKTLQKKAHVLINFHTQNPYKQIYGPRGTTPAGVLTEMKLYQGPLHIVSSSKSPTAPNAPTNITVIAGNSQVTVSWIVPTSDGGSPITGYIITSSPSAGNSPVIVSGNVTTGTVIGLTNGIPYTFTVGALNSVNTGPSSLASISVTPATTPTVTTTSYLQNNTGQPGSVVFTGFIDNNGGSTITS